MIPSSREILPRSSVKPGEAPHWRLRVIRPAGSRLLRAIGCSWVLGIAVGNAGVMREQIVHLQRGWNAVHLEVTPQEKKPGALFAGKPVDRVARYFRLISPVEFIDDPADNPWNKEGWGVWYAPGREDAFLTNLHALDGNQAYLIHATEDFEWSVTGEVRHVRRSWRNGSFNLVGFTVDPQAPPTFAHLFGGAGGSIGQKIYRLQNGRWVKVLSPSNTTLRPGEAFWTYCSGNTDYQGPIDLKVPGSGTLDFGAANQRLSIDWKATGAAVGVSAALIPAVGAGPMLPLHRIERDPNTLSESFPLLGNSQLGGTATAGRLSLLVRREELSLGAQDALLKFSDGAGAIVWVPVTASRAGQ